MSPDGGQAARIFTCAATGTVAAGRRRLGTLFGGLIGALLIAAIFALGTRQPLAGGLAFVLAFGVFIVFGMSRELNVTEIRLEPGRLSVLMRRAIRRLALDNTRARRLNEDEIEHLESLTALGSFVAGSGGFDSHRLGEFDLYATRFDHAVLVESDDGRLIVTPDEPDRFVAAIHEAANSTIPPS